jgi:hypothetical protein
VQNFTAGASGFVARRTRGGGRQQGIVTNNNNAISVVTAPVQYTIRSTPFA